MEIEPDSPFTGDTEVEFANEYAAQVYIGEQLRAIGETYAHYADIFDPLLTDTLSKEDVDTVIAEIKSMGTGKMKLAV